MLRDNLQININRIFVLWLAETKMMIVSFNFKNNLVTLDEVVVKVCSLVKVINID